MGPREPQLDNYVIPIRIVISELPTNGSATACHGIWQTGGVPKRSRPARHCTLAIVVLTSVGAHPTSHVGMPSGGVSEETHRSYEHRKPHRELASAEETPISRPLSRRTRRVRP